MGDRQSCETGTSYRDYVTMVDELRDELAASSIHQYDPDPKSAYRRLRLYERTLGLAVPFVLLRRLFIKLARRLAR